MSDRVEVWNSITNPQLGGATRYRLSPSIAGLGPLVERHTATTCGMASRASSGLGKAPVAFVDPTKAAVIDRSTPTQAGFPPHLCPAIGFRIRRGCWANEWKVRRAR